MTSNELIPALLTPCSEPGKIDFDSLRSLCRFLYAEGVDGVFAVSSTGEMPLLADADRKSIIAVARDETALSRTLYVGVSGTGVAQILQYTGDAADLGADVAVVMAPFFLKLDQQQFFSYATELADNSPLPLAFYHHLRMPTEIEEDTVLRLSEHPNIIGFKETSGDGKRLKNLATRLSRRDFRLFQGSELLVLRTLQEGGHGCVTALANLAPGLHRSLFDAFEKGLHAEAEVFQQKLSALWKIFRLPGVERSFGHFVQTLKIPLTAAGVLAESATLLPGYTADPEFQQAVLKFYDDWKETHSVPAKA